VGGEGEQLKKWASTLTLFKHKTKERETIDAHGEDFVTIQVV
jgi:hypothetical protein